MPDPKPLVGTLRFRSAEFDGQLLRALGYIYYGGADIGECLATASQITDNHFEGWYTGWYATAERVRGVGRVLDLGRCPLAK